MEVWKELTKYWYSAQRNEYKYHTDFSLDEGETIEVIVNGKKLIDEIVPKGELHKIHFEMAEEIYKV